jgi:hypothetical protein
MDFYYGMGGRPMRRTILGFLLLACVVPVLAQKIQITATAAPLEQATISDIDFIRSTTPKWLFTLDLMVYPEGNPEADVLLEIRGDVALASGKSEQDVIYLRTKQFHLAPSRTITNLDLRNPDLRDQYTFDENKLTSLGVKGVALSNSLLPAGVYTLNVSVIKILSGLPAGEVAKTKIVYVLRNPSRVELMFPIDGDRAVTPFPLFQWLYDGPSSRLSIYEKLPGQQSPEEAASGVPILQQDVNTNFFQYPSGGVRALQPGKTYVWYIAGRALSAGGTSEDVQSTLRSFTVTRNEGFSSLSALLEELERALGPKYQSVFDNIREQGLSSTGTLQLNGTTITAEQLRQLVEQIRMKPESVRSVHLE